MTTPLSPQQTDIIFPAHIAVDPALKIIRLGPSLQRHAPWLTVGDHLFDHFRPATGDVVSDFAEMAKRTGAIALSAIHHNLMLAGAVVSQPRGYLLTLNHMPSGNEVELDVTDFGPGDPQLSNLLLIRVQNALIEESRDVASELTVERQRVVDVIERVGRMSGYLAHDLNNFLSVISLNARRLLRTEMRDQRQRHCVNVIVETAERCSEFTQGMMTLANQKSDSRLPFAIDDAIMSAAALFRSACGTKIELRLALESSQAVVDAALNGLVNSIINLLINSRQAMANGGAITLATRIVENAQLNTRRIAASADFVVVSIADQGTGMPPEVLDRAFELFFSTKTSGTGVGLASVRDFAEQMDGWVTIDSIEGKGTTVEIYLPMAGCQVAEKVQRNGASHNASPSRPRILVVDDEDYALEALAEFLQDEDYEVTTARSAEEARAVLVATPHDVLVTDVIMHGIDGIELAHWAGVRQAGIPVILMSGFVPDAKELSSDWLFIRKPIDPDLLCRMIQSVIS